MYHPREYWDKIGKASSVGSGDEAGQFATDETGKSFYDLPKWSSQPQYWEYCKDGARVLDIGSGNGLQVGRLIQRGIFAVGCDISSSLLRIARGNMISHGMDAPMLVQWDGFRMPFRSNSFDRVMTNTVLQHVVNDNVLDNIFSEVARILRSKGLFLITELVSPKDIQSANHVKLRAAETYKHVATKHGFRIQKSHHVVSTYITIQAIYGSFMVRAITLLRSAAYKHYPVTNRNWHGTSYARRVVRKMVLWISKAMDPLVTLFRIGGMFAGQDELVFEKRSE